MAIKIMTLCDVHGEKCPKGTTVETRRVFDRFTGRPYDKDLCAVEWEKEEKANDTFMFPTREVEVDTLPVPAGKGKAKGKKSPRGGGSNTGGTAERWASWAPLNEAYKAWHLRTKGKAAFGRWSPDGAATQKFLEHPDGIPWKEWKPGQPTPT
jgi:hypothetical protein